ncbi:MAG: alpha-rhamnosidase [Sphingobacteriia bacterium]|nr:MAG: alpha-rhamnosidase [Sphingobacteriia bacterium]TAG29262.1 MAG: alpha-rhamnosidase [Sphingobacteriia bacterium]
MPSIIFKNSLSSIMKKPLLCLIPLLVLFVSIKAQDIIHPKNLRCEYLINPIGIDVKQPLLFWNAVSKTNAQKQTAYRILVASSEDNLALGKADLWDSDKIISDQSTQIKYKGKALVSETKAYWKIKIWDKNDKESEWSIPGFFTMGLLNPADWVAHWIGLDQAVGGDKPKIFHPIISARMVRKETEIKKTVKSAVLYISAAGLYEFYINDHKVGDAVLTPALSQTEKRLFYNTYDVANLLKTGKNAFGTYIGSGRWASVRPLQEATGKWVDDTNNDTISGFTPRYPKLLAQINITYTDGSKQTIATDNTWKITADGPITKNNEYDGEFYDATKEMAGWNKAAFNDKSWSNAQLVSTPSPVLSAENKEPIKVMETLKPITVKQIKPGVFIYDMGQNMVGWAKLKVKGKKGTRVKMVFAELLKPDGSLYLDNMRSAEVTDQYILKGDVNGEIWEPRFVYHGFRYVEITGLGYKPDLNTIEGRVVHDAVETIGKFECSNPIMTQLHKNAYWGIRGNYRSMPTDCPQRDERFGWLGDRSIEVKGEAFIFRNTSFYNKWLQDINDTQLENGSISDVAPTHNNLIKVYNDGVVWPSCFVILPYALYLQTGNKSGISRNYDAMKKYANMVISQLKNGLIEKNTYGDWCMPPEKLDMIISEDPARATSGVLLSSCYLYYDFSLLNIYATILGNKDDAVFYKKEALKIKDAINNILYDSEKFRYDNNSIASSIIPLGAGIVPEKDRGAVFQTTIEKLIVDLNTKIATGLIGGQWQMKVLAENGRPDLAYILATNTDYPSWGYQITKGATTIWELWNGDKARPDMNSGNHVMLLGDVIIWMYENVAGIRADDDAPGFKKIIMKPDLSDKLSYVKASHNSLYGNIVSEWKLVNKNFSWNIEVPVNTTALVYMPAENEGRVMVNGKAYSKVAGIQFIKMEHGRAIFEVGSGKYAFNAANIVPPSIQENNFKPTIIPADATFANLHQVVQLKPNSTNATLYYTTDGSEPTIKSKQYTEPFVITKSTVVKAISTKNSLPQSSIAVSNIELYNPEINGWNYTYYEGEWKMIPDFTKEMVLNKGVCSGLLFDGINKREDHWGIVYTSNLLIDEEANYSFYLSSDDGSRLLLDGKQVAIIDGMHGTQTGMGSLRLSKGYHRISIEYFEALGGQSLELKMQVEGGTRKIVPISKLFIQ